MSDAYDRIIWDTARRLGLDPIAIKAVIGTESNFNARAYRFEKHIQDASYGLMQTLYGTAREMGYSGPPEGLYDPAASIEFGARYLKKQLVRYGGDMLAAVAAYNSGTVRRNTDGSFKNQAHVDRFVRWYQRFKGQREPESEPGIQRRPAGQQQTPVRMVATATKDGVRSASLETFMNEETLPWAVAFAGAIVLGVFGGRRR